MGKYEDWYDRQSIENLFLLAVSPMIVLGLILIIIAVLKS